MRSLGTVLGGWIAAGLLAPAVAPALTVHFSGTNVEDESGTRTELTVTVTGSGNSDSVTMYATAANGIGVIARDETTDTDVQATSSGAVNCLYEGNGQTTCGTEHPMHLDIAMTGGEGGDDLSWGDHLSAPPIELTMSGGGGNDAVRAGTFGGHRDGVATSVVLDGGAGVDNVGVYGAYGSIVAHGGEGNDTIEADVANDAFGDGGDDLIKAGWFGAPAPDPSGSAAGGEGIDTYHVRSENSTVALGIAGGSIARLAMDNGTPINTTSGFEGIDADTASGGTVTLEGDDGPNVLSSLSKPGQLSGFGGDDTITASRASIDAGAGSDKVVAKSSIAQQVDCGPDLDTDVTVDAIDTVSNCEFGVSLTGGPTGTVSATAATFNFAYQGEQPAGHFECRLDGTDFATCTAPHTLTGLTNAPHTFEVRFVPDGGGGPTASASRTWTVDSEAPTATITQAPTPTGNAGEVSVAWSGPPDVQGYRCSLDDGPATPCTSPIVLSGLTPGSHTFAITAIDGAGNEQPTPTTVTFVVGEPPVQQSVACAEPAVSRMAFGPIVAFATAEGSCFVTERIDGANVRIAHGPITVNGIALEPLDAGGGVVVDDRLQGGAIRMVGRVKFKIGSFEDVLVDGTTWDGLSTGSLVLLTRASSIFENALMAGLPIRGSVGIKFQSDFGGSTVVTLKVTLPELSFQTLPYEAALGSGGSSVDGSLTIEIPLTTSNEQGVAAGVKVTIAEAWLGIVKVKDLSIGYDHATRTFTGGATLLFGPLGDDADRGITFGVELGPDGIVGPLRKLSALVSGINAPLFSIAYLQRVGIDLARLGEGGPGIALTGRVGVSLGPSLDFRIYRGEPVSLDGAFTVGIPNRGPLTFKGTGTGKLVEFEVGQAELKVTSPLDVRLNGSLEIGVFGYGARLEIKDAWLTRQDFNVIARGTVALPGLFTFLAPDVVEGVMSSRGYAVCIGEQDESVGFGGRWGAGPDTDFFSRGCSLGEYTTSPTARAALAGTLTFEVPSGTRVISLLVEGADGPPALTVSGPGGASFATDPDGHPVADSRAILVQDPRVNGTRIVLFRPRAGRWTISPVSPATTLGTLKIARQLPPVKVRARVRGRGSRRVLTWRATGVGSQRVRFTDRSGGQARVLTTTGAARGRRAFVPLTSRTAAHTIEVTVLNNGLPRTTLAAGRFTVASRPPGRISGLRRSRAQVRWKAAAGAAAYAVSVRRPDGTSFAVTTKRPRYTLPRALARRTATVAVRAVDTLGRLGWPASKRLTAKGS